MSLFYFGNDFVKLVFVLAVQFKSNFFQSHLVYERNLRLLLEPVAVSFTAMVIDLWRHLLGLGWRLLLWLVLGLLIVVHVLNVLSEAV